MPGCMAVQHMDESCFSRFMQSETSMCGACQESWLLNHQKLLLECCSSLAAARCTGPSRQSKRRLAVHFGLLSVVSSPERTSSCRSQCGCAVTCTSLVHDFSGC